MKEFKFVLIVIKRLNIRVILHGIMLIRNNPYVEIVLINNLLKELQIYLNF